jgi:hypothetical protein
MPGNKKKSNGGGARVQRKHRKEEKKGLTQLDVLLNVQYFKKNYNMDAAECTHTELRILDIYYIHFEILVYF